MSQWCELVIRVAQESHDAVADLCRRAGSPGVRIEESAVVAYLPVTGSTRDILRSLRDELERLPEWGLPPVQSVEERILQQTEWATAWQQYFPVQRIGKRVVIKPPWEHYQPQTGEVVVELEPGMAFGTGQHETTQMCIELLEELIQTGMAVVDVGTGSGVLAIVAAKLGARLVWAGDNDPLALLNAQKNVARNGVGQVVSLHLADGCEGAPCCDVLVANLTAEVIERLLPDFARCIHPQGWLVVTGIVRDRSHSLRRLLSRAPWTDLTERECGEWCAFAARRL